MSVFHRVEDIYTMEAALFFRRVACLPAYDGAVAAQHERQREKVDRVLSAVAAPVLDQEEAAWAAHRAKLWPGQDIRIVSASEAFRAAGGA